MPQRVKSNPHVRFGPPEVNGHDLMEPLLRGGQSAARRFALHRDPLSPPKEHRIRGTLAQRPQVEHIGAELACQIQERAVRGIGASRASHQRDPSMIRRSPQAGEEWPEARSARHRATAHRQLPIGAVPR